MTTVVLSVDVTSVLYCAVILLAGRKSLHCIHHSWSLPRAVKLFYYLAKAAHARLAQKLNFYGIRGRLLQLLQSFLANCTQQVVDGRQSSPCNVKAGVPHKDQYLVQHYF